MANTTLTRLCAPGIGENHTRASVAVTDPPGAPLRSHPHGRNYRWRTGGSHYGWAMFADESAGADTAIYLAHTVAATHESHWVPASSTEAQPTWRAARERMERGADLAPGTSTERTRSWGERPR